MKFEYYPGCTAKSMAIEYHESVEETARYLGVELEEIPDLNCCGADLSITNSEMVRPLISKIIKSAIEEGADVIITACHLCQSNLDILQSMDISPRKIPIFFFSELTALSLGSSEMRRWLGKHMVNPFRLLEKLKLL